MLQFYLSMVSDNDDKSRIEFLYKEYRQLMYKTAISILHNKEDVEDAVHEAFLRVIKNITKFRTYSCRENVSYLVIIVKGISLNILTSRSKKIELNDDVCGKESIEDTVQFNIEYNEIVENIKKLSPVLRSVAILRFVEQCTPGEISDLLDMKINAVYASISRARSILLETNEEDHNDKR